MWNKLKYSVQRFMAGRYGVDRLGIHILWVCIVLNILSLFLVKQSVYLNILSDILIFYDLYRTLSKNFAKRNMENTRYLDFLTRVRRGGKVIVKNCKDRQYHYYLCPKCAQIVRVPRGRGKIEIHCPSCGTTFDRKS